MSHSQSFADKLRRRVVCGPEQIALETAKILAILVKISKNSALKEAIESIDSLQEIVPIVSGIVQKLLNTLKHAKDSIKPTLLATLQEIVDDIDSSVHNISCQSVDYIHSDEIIMTCGNSELVQSFLLDAHSKHRRFQLFIAETAPFCCGHEMACRLSKAGVDVTVISDAAIFAVMSRVNKVILGTHAANGALVAQSGSLLLSTSAKFYSTPVVVLAEQYKISHVYPFDREQFHHGVGPEKVVPYEEIEILKHVGKAVCTEYELVGPEFVSLFITNIGGGAQPPSYISRLLHDDARMFDE